MCLPACKCGTVHTYIRMYVNNMNSTCIQQMQAFTAKMVTALPRHKLTQVSIVIHASILVSLHTYVLRHVFFHYNMGREHWEGSLLPAKFLQASVEQPKSIHVTCMVCGWFSWQRTTHPSLPFPWTLTFELPFALRLSHSSTEHNLMSMRAYRLNKPFNSGG